jgi:drug/metabolite transporter (DMT)-like permease
LVVIWAFYGIIIKREASEPLHPEIIATAWASIAIQAAYIIYILVRRVPEKQKSVNS